MARSMTGYGQAMSPEKNGLSFNVEIHSVNRKMLDMNIYLPKEFLHLDIEIRKKLRKEIQRGLVTVKITLKKSKQFSDEKSLKTLKLHWEKTAKSLGFSKEVIDFPFLASQMGNLSLEQMGISQKSLETLLNQTLDKALKDFVKMREQEGKQLVADIKKHLEAILQKVSLFEKEMPKATEKFREKLLDRLKQILEENIEDERILKEVALFAEKIDIHEEITRLKSHLKQAEDLLKKKEEGIGRTLEFIIQEMLREVNTIASKSSNLNVTKATIIAKSEIEKIREQVQNIE